MAAWRPPVIPPLAWAPGAKAMDAWEAVDRVPGFRDQPAPGTLCLHWRGSAMAAATDPGSPPIGLADEATDSWEIFPGVKDNDFQ